MQKTDQGLRTTPGKFLEAYAGAQRRLSELGAKLVGDKGVPAVAVAKKQTSLVREREREGGREGGREGVVFTEQQPKAPFGDGDGRKRRDLGKETAGKMRFSEHEIVPKCVCVRGADEARRR